ncbi:hypothetical protein [Paenibacillus agri]|uniref:DUF4375 domain-containing protein n=1 Tax=Paenibacillus agri TaxID=2744309 RepID=A0A850ES77_9BACL|nr:hypothetical protein [Paenibacillus agri]NUU62124.1 hypothetical protein [Paenibacillus agri]
MSLVTVKQHDFDALDDERLGWICMEPTFQQIRGKEMSVKTQVISQLTKGQQALCMFSVLYDHAKNSVSEYYAWISILLDTPGYWSSVTEGLHFFSDTSMISLLDETKEVLEARNRRLGVQWSDATFKDLDQDHELLDTVTLLFERFLTLSQGSLQQISAYIRLNPQEFVIIKN